MRSVHAFMLILAVLALSGCAKPNIDRSTLSREEQQRLDGRLRDVIGAAAQEMDNQGSPVDPAILEKTDRELYAKVKELLALGADPRLTIAPDQDFPMVYACAMVGLKKTAGIFNSFNKDKDIILMVMLGDFKAVSSMWNASYDLKYQKAGMTLLDALMRSWRKGDGDKLKILDHFITESKEGGGPEMNSTLEHLRFSLETDDIVLFSRLLGFVPRSSADWSEKIVGICLDTGRSDALLLALAEKIINVDASATEAIFTSFIRGGLVEDVKKLVKEGFTVPAMDRDGNPMVHNARTPDMIAFLIEKGFDLNTQNRARETPILHLAKNSLVAQDHKKAVWDTLADKGAELDIADERGIHLYHWALYQGEAELARTLEQRMPGKLNDPISLIMKDDLEAFRSQWPEGNPELPAEGLPGAVFAIIARSPKVLGFILENNYLPEWISTDHPFLIPLASYGQEVPPAMAAAYFYDPEVLSIVLEAEETDLMAIAVDESYDPPGESSLFDISSGAADIERAIADFLEADWESRFPSLQLYLAEHRNRIRDLQAAYGETEALIGFQQEQADEEVGENPEFAEYMSDLAARCDYYASAITELESTIANESLFLEKYFPEAYSDLMAPYLPDGNSSAGM